MRWGVRWTSSDGKEEDEAREIKAVSMDTQNLDDQRKEEEKMKELDEIVLKRRRRKRSDGILSLQEFKWTFCPNEDRKRRTVPVLSSTPFFPSSYSLDQVNRKTTSSFLTQNHRTVCPLYSTHLLLLSSILWSDLFFIPFFYSFQSGDPRKEFQIFFSSSLPLFSHQLFPK